MQIPCDAAQLLEHAAGDEQDRDAARPHVGDGRTHLGVNSIVCAIVPS
jgi:hypothetical protein